MVKKLQRSSGGTAGVWLFRCPFLEPWHRLVAHLLPSYPWQIGSRVFLKVDRYWQQWLVCCFAFCNEIIERNQWLASQQLLDAIAIGQ